MGLEAERRIDATINRLAGRPNGNAAFEAALADANAKLQIEARVPARDANGAVELTRRTIERAVRGYGAWIASQVSVFNRSIVSAVRELGERVDADEEMLDAVSTDTARLQGRDLIAAGLEDALAPTPDEATSRAWIDRALDALGTPAGRVLHADAGTGWMVNALQAAGLDAYGVEPSYSAYEVAADQGVEIHYGDVMEHLRRVPPGALAGIVLSGCVERLGVADLVTIAREAGARLEHQGRLLICSAPPEHWQPGRNPVLADLAPGRPFRAATWVELLTRAHFDEVAVIEGPRPSFANVPSGTPGAAEINANFEAVRALVDAPDWYVVSARRRPVE